MKSFIQKLAKIHPVPPESSPKDPSPLSPQPNSSNSGQRSPSPQLVKKLSLQTQSFSPRPILKNQRKSYVNSKQKSLHSDSERESMIGVTEKQDTQRRKTYKITKVVPENKSRRESEEMDPNLKKALKRKEKMAELNNFEVKFNETKLADKIRKRSIRRSNTFFINEENNRARLRNISVLQKLQRPSDGVLLDKEKKEETIEDPFFHDDNQLHKDRNLSNVNGVNFSEGVISNITVNNTNKSIQKIVPSNLNLNLVSSSKKGRTRKQRTNYRLRFDEKYSKIKYIIFPDDPFRAKWDLVILVFLIYSAIILPFITAFINEQVGDPYFILDIIMDAVFFFDVIINLLSAYTKDDILVTSHSRIFINYLCSGWLIIDLSSCIPLDIILENNSQASNGFIRILKIPRLYKLLKMTRLVRILKIIKERNKILRYFNEVFKLNSGLERVIIAVLMILLFCHIVACLWYMLSDFESDSNYEIWTYMNNLQDLGILDLYFASLHFTVQTVVTVGYGDLHCYSTAERLFASGLMLVGVFVYSFAIGSLTSLMSSVDQKNASYSKSLAILAQIKKEYNVNHGLFTKIKNHLKFGQNYEKNHKKLIEELPLSLRTEVILRIHQEEIQNIPFLQNKPTSFIAFLCPFLKRVKINKNEYIFMKNDPAEEMFFIKSGKVAGVLRKYGNAPFIKIKPGYYFGEVDILFYSFIRRYTFMALKDSEFYILSLKHFKKIFLIEFRDTIGLEFVQEAYYRKKRTKKIYLDALRLCRDNEDKFGSHKNENNGIIKNMDGSEKRKPKIHAKESIYNMKGLNLFGLNADKALGKKSLELAKEHEKDDAFLRKENDYFFREEVQNSNFASKRQSNNNEAPNIQILDENSMNVSKSNYENDFDKKEEKNEISNENNNNINISSENNNIDNNLINNINSNSINNNEEKIYESNENTPNNKNELQTENIEKKFKNFNIKLLTHKSTVESKEPKETPTKKGVESRNVLQSSTLLPPALPTPAKKSFAAKTLQKVLNITKLNKRISFGQNLQKAAQKEALKEKIKFFTDRINKMDQDINNLINFSKKIQEKYQEKLESLKPKPPPVQIQVTPPVPHLRKIGKTHTLSHLNFLKSESLKKKHKEKGPLNTKFRRQSDTTSVHTFRATLSPPVINLQTPEKKSGEDDTLKRSQPLNLHLEKVKNDLMTKRRSSLNFSGQRLERSPSFLLKRKESLLEEGSLVSIEEDDLRKSMVKMKGKVEKSKNILVNASRRGSEMLSYRGGCSPKRIIGKNLFTSISPEKKKSAIDLKPLKRTSSIRVRRKSDQFVDISKSFQRNDSGFFIEKTNKSVSKLSKKLTLNSSSEEIKKNPAKNRFRRNSETLKASGFSKTLKNLESMLLKTTNQTNQTSSSKSSSSSSGSGTLSKVSSKKSSRRSSIKGINLKSPQMIRLRKSFRESQKSIKSFNESLSLSSNDSVHNSKKMISDEDFLKSNKVITNNDVLEEERKLIEDIDQEMANRKEDIKNDRQVKQIGKLKFVLDLKGKNEK